MEKFLRKIQKQTTKKLAVLESEEKKRMTVAIYSPEEKLLITKKVREYVLAKFTDEEVSPLKLNGKEESKVDLDVAFWVAGELRASAILARELSLVEALALCTERALHDGRFRPLEQKELSKLRIELTFFDGLWRPVSDEQIKKNIIDSTAGYVALLKDQPMAWYLPMVYNAINFRNLTELWDHLRFEKGGFSKEEAEEVSLYMFSTTGWIESVQMSEVLPLDGPIVFHHVMKKDISMIRDSSVEWMLRQEHSPGFFSSKLSPNMLQTGSVDWVRLGFTAATFAEIGVRERRDDLLMSSQRIDRVLERELEKTLFISKEEKALAMIYAGHSLLWKGEGVHAEHWLNQSKHEVKEDHMSPIAILQSTMLSLRLKKNEMHCRKSFSYFYAEWQERNETAQLALYPELLALALTLARVTGKTSYQEKAFTIGDWYCKQQNPDGSFPLSLGRNQPYVRGSGKIMEVLSLLPERYEGSLIKGLKYIGRMQYTEENIFHIPEIQKTAFLGGFRHDVLNREAWIDSAGHVGLALSRWQSSK